MKPSQWVEKMCKDLDISEEKQIKILLWMIQNSIYILSCEQLADKIKEGYASTLA
jgi:predicted nucleic acid-binding protein